ncbi:hypothetical protein BDR03DRAFT_76528 [Suillus americanus]|nr:hypothetical protein BDR03DRAFT_76528 [Suillus americanus]
MEITSSLLQPFSTLFVEPRDLRMLPHADCGILCMSTVMVLFCMERSSIPYIFTIPYHTPFSGPHSVTSSARISICERLDVTRIQKGHVALLSSGTSYHHSDEGIQAFCFYTCKYLSPVLDFTQVL